MKLREMMTKPDLAEAIETGCAAAENFQVGKFSQKFLRKF
jgi:hypothetical protein